MISQTESPPGGAQDEIDAALSPEATPEERRARLRDRLISEAWRLISTEGLQAVQARRVAQAASCSVGAIYNVFPDLDELILRANIITMRQLGEAAAAAGATLDGALTVGERVRRLSQVYVGFAFAYERNWRSLFDYRATYRKPYPDWYREAQISAFRDLGHGVLGAPVDTAERLAMVETLWAAVHGVVSVAMEARFRDISRPDIERQVDLLTRLLSGGVDAMLAGGASQRGRA